MEGYLCSETKKQRAPSWIDARCKAKVGQGFPNRARPIRTRYPWGEQSSCRPNKYKETPRGRKPFVPGTSSNGGQNAGSRRFGAHANLCFEQTWIVSPQDAVVRSSSSVATARRRWGITMEPPTTRPT